MVLTQIMFQMVSNGKLSLIAQNAASVGKLTAKNLMVSETVEEYALLLENILTLPSEVAVPLVAKNIPMKLKAEWRWHPFETITNTHSPSKTSTKYILEIEKQLNHTDGENSEALNPSNDTLLYTIWEQQKYIDMANMRKRREDEEVSDFLFLLPFI